MAADQRNARIFGVLFLITFAALKDWTFLFGPGLIVPFGNGLILGYLMYKSGLVPQLDAMARTDWRAAPPDREHRHALRLVGADDHVPAFLVVPEFLWELFLGIYAAVWGFRRDAPILAARSSTMAPQTDAA